MSEAASAAGRKRHYWTAAGLARLRGLLVDAGQTPAQAAQAMGLPVETVRRGATKLGLSRPGAAAPVPAEIPPPVAGQQCAHVTVSAGTVQRCGAACAKGSPWCGEHSARFRARPRGGQIGGAL